MNIIKFLFNKQFNFLSLNSFIANKFLLYIYSHFKTLLFSKKFKGDIQFDKGDSEGKELIMDRLSENSNHHGDHPSVHFDVEPLVNKTYQEELAIRKRIEAELDKKIYEIQQMFDTQITNLEAQIKSENEKNSTYTAKRFKNLTYFYSYVF